MKARDVRRCMEQLAEYYDFRQLPKTKTFVGLHRGVIVELSEWDGIITLKFNAPSANVGDEILESFSGFTHWRDADLPSEWLNGVLERNTKDASDSGCMLTLDSERLETLAGDEFLELPDVIANDFQAHGAAEELACSQCGTTPATVVAVMDSLYAPLCGACWQSVLEKSKRGRLATEEPVRWSRVIPFLTIATIVGAVGWGLLQQPDQLHRFNWLMVLMPAT